jgi:hypothetical protein
MVFVLLRKRGSYHVLNNMKKARLSRKISNGSVI